jgi:hypothetical protein
MAISRSRARQFCQAVSDEAGGRVGRWVPLTSVGQRLELDIDRAVILTDECELAGWVRHDRSHLPTDKRSGSPPAMVTLSSEGWDLIRVDRPWVDRYSLPRGHITKSGGGHDLGRGCRRTDVR